MKAKKFTAVLLSILMLTSLFALPVAAKSIYPESDHPYAENSEDEWVYTQAGNPEHIAVQFSLDTRLENKYDFIFIYDKNGTLVGSYSGDSLSGQTIAVKGDTVRIKLTSDNIINDYGFKVAQIFALKNEDICTVTYDSNGGTGDSYVQNVIKGTNSFVCSDGFTKDGYAFAGWSLSQNTPAVAFPGDSIAEIVNGQSEITLYAQWAKLGLHTSEILPFSNSGYYFGLGEETAHYHLEDEHADMMQKHITDTFLFGPMPSLGYSAVLKSYPSWKFSGSCYGMSVFTLLSHFGKIDYRQYDENAECVNDLEPTPELISAINYYQYSAGFAVPTENITIAPGSPYSKEQLKNMSDAVLGGKLVLFSFITFDSGKINTAHTVILTGGYTDADGNIYLIVYDNSYPYTYLQGDYEIVKISADYGSCHITMWDKDITIVSWNDDFSVYDTVKIDGGSEPTLWYSRLFSAISRWFKVMFSALTSLFTL